MRNYSDIGLKIGWGLAAKRRVPANSLICPVCGTTFIRTGTRKSKCKLVCCSVACKAKSQIGKIVPGFNLKPRNGPIRCAVCGKDFFAPPSQKARYCSIRCRNQDRSFWDHARGENHYNWKGGITPVNQVLRQSAEYKIWRDAVFRRDGYQCSFCKHKGKGLEAHHRRTWSGHPELRFDVDNGITFCKQCHKAIHRLIKQHNEREIQ